LIPVVTPYINLEDFNLILRRPTSEFNCERLATLDPYTIASWLLMALIQLSCLQKEAQVALERRLMVPTQLSGPEAKEAQVVQELMAQFSGLEAKERSHSRQLNQFPKA
jgi:hypothetical protein